MITIDTNVLVRIMIDDPNETAQITAARKYIAQVGKVFIPQIVQVETVWVLCSGYKLSKKEVIALLEHLARNSAYLLEHEQRFSDALEMYRNGKADFSDYLILAAAMKKNTEVATFDKKFSRSSNVYLIRHE